MLKKNTLSAAVALSLGASGNAQAVNFSITFMDFPGAPNPNVVGTVNTTAGTGTFTSGSTPFFGHSWTGTLVYGHDNFGSSTVTGAFAYSMANGASSTGTYNYTLGPDSVAMGILFDWNSSTGIPVLNVMTRLAEDVNVEGGDLWASVDIDNDGTMGTTMQAGPFAGAPIGFCGLGTPEDDPCEYVANTAIPLPAAAWLFSAGLLGLVGVARRRKS